MRMKCERLMLVMLLLQVNRWERNVSVVLALPGKHLIAMTKESTLFKTFADCIFTLSIGLFSNVSSQVSKEMILIY